MRSSHLTLAAIVLLPASAHAQDVSSNWYRSPAISPDGSTIVFTHHGDLYSVSTDGGRAYPLTVSESYETSPVWSSDGEHIAFATDRNGNMDVYVMPSGGGQATRLTYHSGNDLPWTFTPDDSGVYFSSTRTDDLQNAQFPSGLLSELYEVSLSGGTPSMVLTTPALDVRFAPDGSWFVYEDLKGYENALRKHHQSPVARDIWRYDPETGAHTQLTDFPGEDREPVVSDDGEWVYFLSERNGDSNIFRMRTSNPGEVQQLTRFEDHPVRHLSIAGDGTMVFSWHGDLYRMTGDGQPTMVEISIAVDSSGDESRGMSMSNGVTSYSPSPSGKEVAFVVRGDVFVTSADFGTTRRITNTPEQERSVDFAPDGRSIIYAGERGGSWNVYQATLADEDELYFFSATKIEETALVDTDHNEFQPAYSPDGKKVAYMHNRTELRVLDLDSGESTIAMDGEHFYSYSDGDFSYSWAPDSQWLAVHYYGSVRVFTQDIGLVHADGSQPDPINLTLSGYEEGGPEWFMDGEVLLWSTDRWGQRSHASWGALGDVVGVFLTQDAYDRFTLSKEEYELKKELEEKKKEKEDDSEDEDSDEDSEDENADGEDEEGDDEEEIVEPLEFELDNLRARMVRLTQHSSNLADAALSTDGDKLFYLARFEGGLDLWVRDFREGSTKILAKLNANGASMEMSDDGKSIFLVAGGRLMKVDAESGKQDSISFNAEIDVHGPDERRYLFDHMWRQVKEKFYVEDMHGADWDWYYEQYLPKVESVSNNRDLEDVFSEILGELNASHTGGRYSLSRQPHHASTATLGIYFDHDYQGNGVRIERIIVDGPLDTNEVAIEDGMVITHIDGVLLDETANYYELLDGKSGDRVRLTVVGNDGEAFDEVVMPEPGFAELNWRYEEWLEKNHALVEALSGGRLGYSHIRGMNDGSFRRFFDDVLGRNADKEGLVIDTRFNGGGWLHDDLLQLLSGEQYMTTIPRNIEAPGKSYYMDPLHRWVKPTIVVMSESNYSNAHMFPWAYSRLGFGKTVGTGVAGTGTAVWWEGQHTGDIVFGIPQVGLKGMDGEYLENQLLEPDVEVILGPNEAAAGEDNQLVEAVRVLLEDIDAE
ncbi:MAG: S41 family peptidase [Planctomycetota bacterium]|jgi:Tol biopolymer transport system component/C-terminal processing protease CtpA/Prc